MVTLSALAMLALLLAAASISLSRWDGVAFYAVLVVVCVALVSLLWRRERALRRAAEAALPAERRTRPRVTRRPITFPLVESVLTFAFWYLVAVGVDRVVTGTTTVFTLAAVAPFAAFMLATLTIAGRHMAFRLTAEENEERAADQEGTRGATG
jgi:Ca2+/Na+ antiporter